MTISQAIPVSDWPKLDEEQKEVLSRLITHHLAQTTAADNVKLISDKMWQVNKLPFESSLLCLNMIDHYNLRLPDSTILVEHFLYGDEHTEKIVRYFKRNGLGPSDGRKIDALFRPELHEIALRPLMRVFAEFNVNVGLIREKLLYLIRDLHRDVQLRVDAFRRYIKISDADITPFLAETADSPDTRLAHEVREELVKRQHIPTIMRLLADLLDGKFDIPRGTSWATGRDEIDWLDNIHTASRAVWDALVKVTAQAIKNRQYGFLHVLLLKMSRMNLRGTLHVVQSRLGSATDSSLISMLEILENDLKNEELHELGRVKSVNGALEIIASTKPLRKVVIYVEGGNDRTLYKALLVKFCDRGLLPSDVQYFFSPKGGWSNIYRDRDNFGDWIDMNKPDPIFVLVDRDFDAGRISECEHLWQALNISYHILKLKSPEIYYSPSLLKKAIGYVPVSIEEIKRHTRQIAKTITLRDIEGTDLYQAFAEKLKKILS